MNPRHLPLPLLAASIVGVIRPASAIQPDTQAIFGGSEAYMLPLPVEHLVVLLVVAVGCIGLLAFYDRVDEWAAATLLSIPREDNIVATARSATLQKQNSELRKMWVGSVIVMTTSLLRTVDHFSGCFVCVVLPMAAMTVSTSANSKWGWLNQGMQFVWLARRMALPHALLGPEAKLFFTVMSAHLWNEFSLEGFCAIFVLHAATNLTVLLTSPDQLSRSMMLSLAMLTLFVYRRRAPPSSGNKGAQQQDGLEIADDRSRSMQLISTALESKDRMSPASKQALLDLQELLSSATAFAAPFEFPVQTCSDSSSESKLSTGTGVGAVQASSTFQPPNLDILAATALQRVPSLQMRLQQPGPEICAAPDQFDHQYRSQGSSLDAWSLAQLQHKQQPQSYNSTVRFPPIARQQPMAVGPYSAGLPIPLGWPTPIAYSEQLVRLSFDGMAQVQVRTGAMLWTNQAFVRLCKLIGGGQLEAGLVSLHDRFCQDLSTEAQCLHSTFGAGDKGFRLWSTTTIVGPPGQEVMLWVLHHSMGGGDSSGTCLLYTSDAADEEDSVDLGGRRIIKKKKKKHTER
eukprot:TRINITY_DN132_c0_g1_i1.p1 TRINITY_DN132_c0_g1~~TRINITY_DN132_c0_g1_i1.p1  ORF type:complete len:572 (-),score=163.90 TRINITY_DN132_c0_g1_i1:73-1788(-)